MLFLTPKFFSKIVAIIFIILSGSFDVNKVFLAFARFFSMYVINAVMLEIAINAMHSLLSYISMLNISL